MKLGKALGFGLFATVLLSTGGFTAAAETLRVGGTGAATAMFAQLFSAFGRGAEVNLEVVPSLGTSGGLRALGDGAIDIAVSGRMLTPAERALGLNQRVAIRTPYVLVTSHPRPNGYKAAEVAALFKIANAKWEDGSAVRIILRPKSDSDSAVLAGMFPDMTEALEAARKRPDVPIAPTDQDNADLAERAPSSLSGATYTQIVTEKRNLRFIAIDNILPSPEALENGTYPYAKKLYFVLSARKNALAENFLAFLESQEGLVALRAAGNLPAAD